MRPSPRPPPRPPPPRIAAPRSAPAGRHAAGNAGAAGGPGRAQAAPSAAPHPAPKAAPAAPPRRRPHGSMLFVSHDLKERDRRSQGQRVHAGAGRHEAALHPRNEDHLGRRGPLHLSGHDERLRHGDRAAPARPPGLHGARQRPGQHARLRQQSDGHGVAHAGPPRWPHRRSGPGAGDRSARAWRD